jgi:hypothetical protein
VIVTVVNMPMMPMVRVMAMTIVANRVASRDMATSHMPCANVANAIDAASMYHPAAVTAVSNPHAAATVAAAGKTHAAPAAATEAPAAAAAAHLNHETIVLIADQKRGERPGHLRSGRNRACNDHSRSKRRQSESARKRGAHNHVLHLRVR